MNPTVRHDRTVKQAAETRIMSRVWVCSACGLKLFLAQNSFYPGIKCLCGRSYWRTWKEEESQ